MKTKLVDEKVIEKTSSERAMECLLDWRRKLNAREAKILKKPAKTYKDKIDKMTVLDRRAAIATWR